MVATPDPDGGAAEVVAEAKPIIVVRNLALTVIGALAVILVLQYAQSVLVPIVLGVLISYGLAPFVNALQRLRIPRAFGAGIAVGLLVGGIGLGIYTLSDQAMAIVSDIPTAAQRVREQVRAHRRTNGGALEKVQRAATEIDRAAQEAASTTPAQTPGRPAGVQQVEVVEPFRPSDYLWSGSVGLLGFTAQFLVVLFLVYFFLVTGDLYKRKLVKIGGTTLSEKKITVQILDEINVQIENFMRVQVFTSFLVSVATGIALWWLGVDHPVVWGLLAGIFNSIPYLGPVLVTAGLGVVSFMQFDDLLRTAYVCGVAFAITSLEGFLLTPMLMGRAAQMNPVAIFIGLLFWSWIWGIWGTVLAVPMLMMIKAICDHIEDLQPVGELLGE
ncbi:MAG TPA: AI-2E family transporter [Vicinamibacterales bacterium]|nr:AI-2E family transporter [Vicinamibacterales bacterium]